MSDGEDVASVKREAKAQILDMLQTLAQVKVTEKEIKRKKKGKESDSDSRSGKESNP